MSVTEQRVKIMFLQGSQQLFVLFVLLVLVTAGQNESRDMKLDKHVQINYKVCLTSKIQKIYIANKLSKMYAAKMCLNLTALRQSQIIDYNCP